MKDEINPDEAHLNAQRDEILMKKLNDPYSAEESESSRRNETRDSLIVARTGIIGF